MKPSTEPVGGHKDGSCEDLLAVLGDLVGLAEAAMADANADGAGYDIDSELADARAAIAKAHGEPSA